MATRRDNGDGQLYERADGRWEARFRYADPLTGESRRSSSYGRTKTLAKAAMREKRQRLEAGQPVSDARVTLGAFAEQWARTTLAVSDRKESTRETYEHLSRRHLQRGPIAAKTLDRLRPSDVEALVLRMREAGLAPSTIRQTYTVLRAVLDGAVRDGLVARNVAALVKRPPVPRVEARHLDADELRRLLAALGESQGGAVALLLVLTGLRRGEALALRWEDVDLVAGVARITGTLGRVRGELQRTAPKTERSRRAVPLSVPAVELLQAQAARQEARRAEVPDLWQERGYVFATATGGPLDPRNVLRGMHAAAERAGLGRVGLHALRHSAASALLSAGVPLKAVSDLLGHSSVAITGDVYGHLSPDVGRNAAETLAAAVGRGRPGLTPILTPIVRETGQSRAETA